MRHLFLAAVLVATTAYARNDDGRWDNADPEIKDWFQHVMQPDNPFVSCCGVADGYTADTESGTAENGDLKVVVTDGQGRIPDGSIFEVPRKKIQTKYGNPTGHGIIFIGQGSHPIVYCYIPLPLT